jgi:hypothetical protein
MHKQNVHSALGVGAIDKYMPIEPAGAQQGRVKDDRPVGRRQ